MQRINVTKTFMPPIEEYERYLADIWSSGQITNQGPLVLELERKLMDYLQTKNLHFVTNGTIAIQVALNALDITSGEVITTPFSYVATTSAILWERCAPIFVDIEPNTFCIDADKIERAITSETKAILAVHVFGYPCNIEKIEAIAKKHRIKVIYDGAHAFGATYNGKSLLDYGDVSMCSFHATKPFHTIEGGCVIVKDDKISEALELVKRFGHNGDEHYMLGINAKASEFQAAMGLCNLNYVEKNITERKKISDLYDRLLGKNLSRPIVNPSTRYNYAYYPSLLDSESRLLKVVGKLNQEGIYPRRYFFPSLNTLPYLKNKQNCPTSEDISRRIICLPLYAGLEEEYVNKTCEVIKNG